MIELIEFNCQGPNCKLKWKALPNSTQTHCWHCSPAKEFISHDRTISPHKKKPEKALRKKIEAPEHKNALVTQARTQLISRNTRSWNQLNLKKKYGKNPDIAKCGCGNFFMKKINKFGCNKIILVTSCPQCGESSDFQTQLAQI